MTTIQLRRDAEANWASANPVLAPGEPGYAIDTHVLKVGDGSTQWVDLPRYIDEAAITADFVTAKVGTDGSIVLSQNGVPL